MLYQFQTGRIQLAQLCKKAEEIWVRGFTPPASEQAAEAAAPSRVEPRSR
jgi:hypothetical protein